MGCQGRSKSKPLPELLGIKTFRDPNLGCSPEPDAGWTMSWMRTRLLTGLLAICTAVGVRGAAPAPQEILLASDAWHNLTRPDGSGLYFDLIRAVFEPAEVKVKVTIVPYARSVNLVQAKKADAWVASFMKEQPFPLYPKWHFDRNRQLVISPRGTRRPFKNQDSFRGARLVWLRYFNLDKYLSVPVQFQEIDKISSAFPMLLSDHADYFIGAESDIKSAIQKNEIDLTRFQFDFLMYLNLYLAFADTEQGRALRDLWDRRMEALSQDEGFRKIYAQYGYPVPFN